MQKTTNLLLNKPDLTDYVNVNDLNDNMDILDTTIGEMLGGEVEEKANKSYVDEELPKKVNKNGDTMTGILKAQSNTSYNIAQTRNIILSTTDAVADNMQNGEIWIKYV